MGDSEDEIFCGPITEKERAVSAKFAAEMKMNKQRSFEDSDKSIGCEMLRPETDGAIYEKESASNNDINSSEVDVDPYHIVDFSNVSTNTVQSEDYYNEGNQKSAEASSLWECEILGSDADDVIKSKVIASNEDTDSLESHAKGTDQLADLPLIPKEKALANLVISEGDHNDENEKREYAELGSIKDTEYLVDGTYQIDEHALTNTVASGDDIDGNQKCEYAELGLIKDTESLVDGIYLIDEDALNNTVGSEGDHSDGNEKREYAELGSIKDTEYLMDGTYQIDEHALTNTVASGDGSERNLKHDLNASASSSLEEHGRNSNESKNETSCGSQKDEAKLIDQNDMFSSPAPCTDEDGLVISMSNLMRRRERHLKAGLLGPRIEDEGDSVLVSPSSANASPDMNNTLDAIDLLLKHGVDYMMCPDDTVLGEQEAAKRVETGVEEKPAVQNNKLLVVPKTPSRNVGSPRIGSGRVQHVKYARTPLERLAKPANIRSQNFRNVVSPVASYIKNRPPPSLLQTVRACNSKKLTPRAKAILASPPQWTKGLKKLDIQNERCATPVLPIVSYETAPGVNMNTMGAEGGKGVKGTGIKLLKHTGRAVLGSIPEISGQEVSLLYCKEVSRSNTLKK